jgi:hypothetical protein
MTDAPVDLDELQSYCAAAAGLPGATAIGVDSRDLARLIAEVRAARASPPADEVAGLLSGAALVREVMSRPGEWTAASHRVAVDALDRIENHLKGER